MPFTKWVRVFDSDFTLSLVSASIIGMKVMKLHHNFKSNIATICLHYNLIFFEMTHTLGILRVISIYLEKLHAIHWNDAQ